MQVPRTYRYVPWAVAASAFCAGLQAQPALTSPWYVAPSVTLLVPDRQWSPDRRALGFGLRIGHVLDPNWHLRFGVETARSKDNGSSYRQTLLGLDVVYLFDASWRGWRPLLVFGVGSARDSVSRNGGLKNTMPFFSAGLGLRYQVSDTVGLQLEWKTARNISQHESPSAFGPGNSDNQYLGFALNYSFGARGGSKPAATHATSPLPRPLTPTASGEPATPTQTQAAPASVKPAPLQASIKPASVSSPSQLPAGPVPLAPPLAVVNAAPARAWTDSQPASPLVAATPVAPPPVQTSERLAQHPTTPTNVAEPVAFPPVPVPVPASNGHVSSALATASSESVPPPVVPSAVMPAPLSLAPGVSGMPAAPQPTRTSTEPVSPRLSVLATPVAARQNPVDLASSRRPHTETFTLQATELFEFDNAELRRPQPRLNELASMLKRHSPTSSVVVTGHTDRLGSDAYNHALSQRRADSVKHYLVKQGVSSVRVRTVPKGKSEPVKLCDDKDRAILIRCLAPNRRAVIEPITIEHDAR